MNRIAYVTYMDHFARRKHLTKSTSSFCLFIILCTQSSLKDIRLTFRVLLSFVISFVEHLCSVNIKTL